MWTVLFQSNPRTLDITLGVFHFPEYLDAEKLMVAVNKKVGLVL